MSCHHTRAHTYIRELIKNSQPIRSRFTSHPMEPLSPTIDERRSFDRLYTFLPPLPLCSPSSVRDQVYCGLVRSRGRNSDLPVAPRLPLKELRVLPTSRVPSCFYGILPQLPQRCSIKGICTFPISPANIRRISCELLANYRPFTYYANLFQPSSPTSSNVVESTYAANIPHEKRNYNTVEIIKTSRSRQSETAFQLISIFLIRCNTLYASAKGHKEGVWIGRRDALRITKAAIRDFDLIGETKRKSRLCNQVDNEWRTLLLQITRDNIACSFFVYLPFLPLLFRPIFLVSTLRLSPRRITHPSPSFLSPFGNSSPLRFALAFAVFLWLVVASPPCFCPVKKIEPIPH